MFIINETIFDSFSCWFPQDPIIVKWLQHCSETDAVIWLQSEYSNQFDLGKV